MASRATTSPTPAPSRTLRPRSGLAAVSALAVGCAPAVGVDPGAELPPIAFERALTDGITALDNLDHQVDALSALGDRPALTGTLVRARLQRAAFLGTYSDFDAALVESADDPALHAEVLATVHRFDEALAANPAMDDTIDLARAADLDQVVADRQAMVQAYPTARHWANLAAGLSARGDYADADEAYEQALAAYRDVSPFFVAQVQFQRGVMWGERADDPARARALYEDAVRLVPDYVTANVHLSEMEFDGGQVEQAINRLQRLEPWTEDAEPASRLAGYTEGQTAADYTDKAAETYDDLLVRHRLAFTDHAVEFLLGPGDDPARARQLAAENLRNRPTNRATRLAIEAAFAAGEDEAGCALVVKVRDPVEVGLIEVVEAFEAECR